MPIFKRSYVQGNPMLENGTSLEFKDGYYETSIESEIALLKAMGYEEVKAVEKTKTAPAQPSAKTGQISSSAIIGSK